MTTEKRELHTTTKRVLKIVKHLIEAEKYETLPDIMEAMGMNPKNAWKLENGYTNLTLDNIIKFCDLTNASPDYLFGYSNIMFRGKQLKPLEMMKQAVKAIEEELKQK